MATKQEELQLLRQAESVATELEGILKRLVEMQPNATQPPFYVRNIIRAASRTTEVRSFLYVNKGLMK